MKRFEASSFKHDGRFTGREDLTSGRETPGFGRAPSALGRETPSVSQDNYSSLRSNFKIQTHVDYNNPASRNDATKSDKTALRNTFDTTSRYSYDTTSRNTTDNTGQGVTFDPYSYDTTRNDYTIAAGGDHGKPKVQFDETRYEFGGSKNDYGSKYNFRGGQNKSQTQYEYNSKYNFGRSKDKEKSEIESGSKYTVGKNRNREATATEYESNSNQNYYGQKKDVRYAQTEGEKKENKTVRQPTKVLYMGSEKRVVRREGDRSGQSDTDPELEQERARSRQRMHQSYAQIMDTCSRQQRELGNRPEWVKNKITGSKEPDELTVTHVNQTKDLYRAEGMEAGKAEQQTSSEWLKTHSIEHMGLTLKHLVDKGKICRPVNNKQTGKSQQHIQFEANDINEFELKLNMAIELFTKRIKWLLTGSRKLFGLVKGSRVGVVVDCSEANFGFGRMVNFKESLTHLLEEQLSEKKALYMLGFGTEVNSLWDSVMDVNKRTIDEAKMWVDQLQADGGCNLLKALKHICKVKELNTFLIILGSVPDQNADILCDYIEQLQAGRPVEIFTVAYDCSNHHTNVTLRRLAEQSSGSYHCYSTAVEEQIYTGTDISILLKEIQIAQDIINKIKEMRQGLLGTALVTVMDEITNEVAKLPKSRFLPRPPGHEHPLRVQMPTFNPSSSEEWLSNHGLKGKNLDLYQVLAPNAFSYKEEFIPVIRKTVTSQVNEKAMTQFQWHDGSVKNVHVDMTQLFEYQKQLGASVKIYEKRMDWLSSGSRKIFGTVTENSVVILLDLCLSNQNYLVHIQHSMRLILEEQLANKDYFNIIGFGTSARFFRPTVVKPTPENLQAAWNWVMEMECEGGRDFMGALRAAVENDEELKHNVEVEGMYLFTSGIPDQSHEHCQSYLEEACGGRNLKLHVILFNVDDYDSHGAIPSRYANITITAEILRSLAHCSGGRFHWFRETGIIESDDIAAISLEIEKALNFSKKCAMLVDSVKKKYNIDYYAEEMLALPSSRVTPALPAGTQFKALPAPKTTGPPPKHTKLTETRMRRNEEREMEEPVPKALAWRPSSATKRGEDGKRQRPSSAKENQPRDPMARVKSSKNKVQTQCFYTGNGKEVGTVFKKYPKEKSVRKGVPLTRITEKEDQITTKDWMRMYSLSRLKLDLNKLVSGPDCKHVHKHVKPLQKTVEARSCNIFPTINVAGTLKHLQLLPHELTEFEEQMEKVLVRYIKRLQWLLSGSRRIFGTCVEKRCVFLIDTSGSMDIYMEELKKELASLIWDQLFKHRIAFNLVHFSRDCESWRSSVVKPTEENCHDAIKWVSRLVANGNTCTLEALQMAFSDPEVDAVYLLTDGKPDTSTSLVLRRVAELNEDRNVIVNTISFNCDDSTANNFLKMLSSETGGRYHCIHTDFDAHRYAHKLLTEGFNDPEHPALPEFESDDLRRLANEIATARRYLAQSRSYRAMYDNLREETKSDKISQSHSCMMVGPGQRVK